MPSAGDLAAHASRDVTVVCPGDPGWPPSLDDLGAARPYALWVRGPADLRSCCGQSAAIAGARAATSYGTHLSTEIATGLARREWTVVSGGAYGIDASAHQATVAADGVTIAVLACGPDVTYPREHRALFSAIAARGALVSESPPGTPPGRQRFLLRNRLIAALSRGTVVIEAAARSGTMATARYASELGRPLMAVPGPVTSVTSGGCHVLIRDRDATCVTGPADVITCLSAS